MLLFLAALGCSSPPPVSVDAPELDAAVEHPPEVDSGEPDPDTGRADLDGDGYTTDDCAETDPDVHPGAAELCNGVDDDCDGAIDAGALDAMAWYLDRDDDTYGDSAATVTSCAKPAGYTAFDADCDDADPAVNPAEVETCDGVDSNCSGSEDDAIDAEDWFEDGDGDGWGFSPRRACAARAGLVVTGGDCADGDAARHPGVLETCNGWDDDCNDLIDDEALDAVPFYADVDGDTFGDAFAEAWACAAPDGFVGDDTDCDDADAAVGGPISWYVDGDGDGYGDAVVWACEGAAGTVALGGDCDDAAVDTWPGAPEVCDSAVDLDCDGLTGDSDDDGDGRRACEDCDDTDGAVAGPGLWYADRDGDGFGDGATSIAACSAPAGFVADATDCNDASAVAWPGAPEVWYDGEDEDCAGGDDWDADLDGFRADEDDCLDTNAAVNPAALEVCGNHVDDDCDGTASGCSETGTVSAASADYAFDGEMVSATFGRAWSAAIDFYGVGDSAIVVSASWNDVGKGAVYIGALSDFSPDSHVGSWRAVWTGQEDYDEAGSALSLPGDFDGDGVLDVAVGAPDTLAGGAVYLIPVDSTGTQSLALATQRMTGTSTSNQFGTALVAAGDLDGNGADELLVSDPGAMVAAHGEARGCVYYFEGPLTSTIEGRTGQLCGFEDRVGWAQDFAVVDTQADGLPELATVSESSRVDGVNVGRAAFLELPFSGAVLTDAADVYLHGTADDRRVQGIGAVGDVNGDGYPDVYAASAEDTDTPDDAGVAFVFFGPQDTTETLDDADLRLYGTEADEDASLASRAGDVDGDGADDLVLAAPAFEDNTPARVGLWYGPITDSASLDDADLVIESEARGDNLGSSVLGPGDLDADGFDDLLLGAWDAASGTGRGYVWFGSGG